MNDLGNIELRRVENMDDVAEFFQWLSESREFLAYDVETTGLIVGWDKIRLAQFGDGRMGWAMDWTDWKGVAREAIHKYTGKIVMHNALFDMKMSMAEGVVVPQAQAHCSMIMAHLTDPAAAMGLKKASARWVDPRAAWGQDMLKQCYAERGEDWATIPTWVPAYWMYGVLDTCLSSLLAEKLDPDIRRQPYELEMATIACLRDAEIAGLRVDQGYRELADEKLSVAVDEIEQTIEHLYPGLNPASDKQVIDALHKLGAVWSVYTENDNLSVDKDVLAWLGRDEQYRYAQLATALGKWRTADRLLYNYIRKFDHIGSGLNRKGRAVGLAAGGILHPSTKPVAARTGRMSITDPPLQTLPRGRVVRDAIVPRDGHVFVMADFAGMEMRALASMANEQNMLAMYARGEDVHDATARALYGENFTKPQRTVCKNGGFSKVYGAGAEKFATTAKIDVDVAKTFLAQYDEMYPAIPAYMQAVMGEVIRSAGGKRKGYGHVTLIDGRWLPVEADKPYKGVNFTIQGGCAVVLKKKIVELDAVGLGAYFRLPVHDELLLEVPIEEAGEVRQTMMEVMPERDLFPNVTLEVESDIVHRWGAHYTDFPKYIQTEDAEWLREL